MMVNKYTVPVFVDSQKNIETFNMTRCVYLTIENSPLEEFIFIEYPSLNIPISITNYLAIIMGPIGGGLFNTTESFDQLYETVESNGDKYVDQNDIWFPNSLFRDNANRSDVYRVPLKLFNYAYMNRESPELIDEFYKKYIDNPSNPPLEFSGVETIALKSWSDIEINLIKDEYMYSENKLLKKDDLEGPRPLFTK